MKNLKIYLTAAVCCMLSVSCLVDDEIDVNSETFSSPLVVGFKQARVPANFVQETDAIFDYEIPVHLIGGASGQPSASNITVSYEQGTLADLALSDDDIEKFNGMNDNGTPDDDTDDYRNFPLAELGTHFNFPDASRETMIPNNGTFSMVPLEVINNSLDAGKTTLLVVNLKTVTSVDNVVISEQLKSVLVQLQLCRTDLVGNYAWGGNQPSIPVIELEPGLYRASYMPQFGATYYFDFTACAGELTIVGWEFNESNSTTGTYYVTQGVPGIVNGDGDLVFSEVSMTDISWYVNLTWTLTRN